MECSDILWWVFVVFCVTQVVRLVMADADLCLMWAERFGKPIESLTGKVVWITGASSGIGEYIAYELARVKCKLILSARREDELMRVKQQCMSSSGAAEEDIFVLPLDQSNLESHENKANEAWRKYGYIDILVNNAGRGQRALIAATELAVDQTIMNLNYLGVVSLTKQVLPSMLERNQGQIVVTSSIAGKVGTPFLASYSASKHALQGWFDSLRTELGTKPIAVTVVCPGPVFSNITRAAMTGKVGEAYGQETEAGITRMNTARCAQLMALSIANRLDEVWISRHPALLVMYVSQYLPGLFRWLARKVGPRVTSLIRRGKKET